MEGGRDEEVCDDIGINFFMTPYILSVAEAQEALIGKAKAEGKVNILCEYHRHRAGHGSVSKNMA